VNRAAYLLYLMYCISIFIRLPARFDALALVRIDFVLIAVISLLIFLDAEKKKNKEKVNTSARLLSMLIIYVFVTLPFVEWPGSVLHTNSLIYLQGLLFFFFSVQTLTTEDRLKTFVSVFLACQLFRVAEPLYLHFTEGYWGSMTNMGGSTLEMMNRLSGSPYDIVNPNGLAFIIASVLPFLYFLPATGGAIVRLGSLALLPPLMYALVLTASRTGIVAVVAVLFGIFVKSKRKLILLAVAVVGVILIYGQLSDIQKDRYLSIGKDDAETAKERTMGVIRDFEVAMRKPIFGHGLGTSLEANFNATGVAQLSHNLYTELLQELGIVGLLIFFVYIKSIITNYAAALKQFKESPPGYLLQLTHALQVWLLMNLVFSLASYGLSSYEWYLFGGLSVVLARLASRMSSVQQNLS
jgi:putative inorganic carbon (hco3(-)) transporter